MNKKLFTWLLFTLPVLGGLALLYSVDLVTNVRLVTSLTKEQGSAEKATQTKPEIDTPQASAVGLDLALPQTDPLTSFTNYQSQTLFSLPTIHNVNKGLLVSENSATNKTTSALPNLFNQTTEPKTIFNSPLGAKILFDDENEISGLELNYRIQKNL